MTALPPTTPTTNGLSRFPCKQCGARVEFAPGTDVLVCPYCGASNPIGQAHSADRPDAPETALGRPTSGEDLELDFAQALSELEHHADKFEHLTVKCDSCAAEIEAPPNTTSFPCPFCGSNIVATAKAATHIKPGAILPFKMTQDQARGLYRKWVASRWFAPSRLKRESFIDATFTGTYVPSWTYDCATRTRYSGQRGDAYYVTRTRTVNGRTQTYQERRVNWTSVSGVVANRFDDVLVLATKSLNEKQLDELDPWNTRECVAYNDAYLAGFRAEVYQITLKDGFDIAKDKMLPTIQATIRSDIGGDEQRIDSTATAYSNITFKHLLLPVWLSAYRFNQKVFRFMVNARTGEVVGERPYSWIKITLFTLMCIAIVLAIVGGLMLGNR